MNYFCPDLINHSTLVNDKLRNEFYKNAIDKSVKDKVVIDVGSGTGILSFYALAAGAKFVYAVEINPQRAAITQVLLQANFDKSRFQVLNIDFWDRHNRDKFKHKIDVFLSETISSAIFCQGAILSWYAFKEIASDEFISIPDTFSIDVYEWYGERLFNENSTSLRNQTGISEVVEENTLDPRIEKTLRAFDKFYFNSHYNDARWESINDLPEPDKIHENALVVNVNDKVMTPHFTLKFDDVSTRTLGHICKMSFGDQTTYFKDWLCDSKYVGIFNVKDCSSVRFAFKNHPYHPADNCESAMGFATNEYQPWTVVTDK